MKISEHEISILDFKSTSSLCIRFTSSDVSVDSRPAYTEVEWINYCPDVFRILQDYGKVDFDDYMASICGQVTLRQIFANGKGGALLRLSHDDRFVVKTITKSEKKVFLENLPSYYHHVRKYKNTLLTKFYGLHSAKSPKAQKVYFVVMGNVLHSDVHIHKRFNLNTTQSRGVNNESISYDELDIVFHLGASTRNQLLMQLKHDCNFLEATAVVDYTLLLGIHLNAPPNESLNKGSIVKSQPLDKGACSQAESVNSGSSSPTRSLNDGSGSPEHPTGSEDGSDDGKSVSSRDGDPQSSPQACILQSNQDHVLSPTEELYSPPRTIRPEEKLGVELPACALRKNLLSRAKGRSNNVVLFFEITNILNQYTIGKRVENVFKSLQPDSLTSPPGNPKAYSNHFQEFVCQIFPVDTEL